LSFAEATASKTGKDKRSVQRDAERGANISADVLDFVSGTALDKGTYLDGLKSLPADQQRAKVEADLAKSKRKPTPPCALSDDQERKADEGDEVRAKAPDAGEKRETRLMAVWLAASAKERSEFLSRLDRPALAANGEAITVDDVKALKAKLRDYKDRVRDAKATRDSALSSMERLQRENAALRDELHSFRLRKERAAPSTPEDAIDEVQERAANGETVTVDVVKELKGKLKD